MFRIRRNKSELIVLTGAIYSFVAYLTAFTLEILFLIDLTRRNDELLSAAATSSSGSSSGSRPSGPPIISTAQQLAAYLGSSSISTTNGPDGDDSVASSFERFTFEAMQAHITISCLAISILYFVIFITSLLLIVALILRSTFVLLTWMCAMTTLYLPEFGLVTYVSVYSWGLGTRNGQVELGFYLFRALLNLVFIFRAHKLFKQWNYEKHFFRLKSTTAAAVGGRAVSAASRHHHFGHYDSPYFITGDSLTTTINPVFSSSTLNLNRYDYVRSGAGTASGSGLSASGSAASRNTSPTTNQTSGGGRDSSVFSRELPAHGKHPEPPSKFYLGDQTITSTTTPPGRARHQHHGRERPTSATSSSTAAKQQMMRATGSTLSINLDADLDADYEMDLDYRTLSARRHTPTGGGGQRRPHEPQVPPSARYYQHQQRPYYQHNNNNYYQHQYHQQPPSSAMSRSQDNLTFSTQSLDRRHLRGGGGEFVTHAGATEQVVLRPLGHQPFEYLQRPGSTSNLNSVGVDPNASNTQTRRNYHYGR